MRSCGQEVSRIRCTWCFDQSDHRPYPFCDIYDLWRYHAFQYRTRLCAQTYHQKSMQTRKASRYRRRFYDKACRYGYWGFKGRISRAYWEAFVYHQRNKRRGRQVREDHQSGSWYPWWYDKEPWSRQDSFRRRRIQAFRYIWIPGWSYKGDTWGKGPFTWWGRLWESCKGT